MLHTTRKEEIENFVHTMNTMNTWGSTGEIWPWTLILNSRTFCFRFWGPWYCIQSCIPNAQLSSRNYPLSSRSWFVPHMVILIKHDVHGIHIHTHLCILIILLSVHTASEPTGPQKTPIPSPVAYVWVVTEWSLHICMDLSLGTHSDDRRKPQMQDVSNFINTCLAHSSFIPTWIFLQVLYVYLKR